MDILSIIGVIALIKIGVPILIEFAIGFRSYVLARYIKRNFVKDYGKWAVVTGCTDGIGKAYMEELAQRGMNIILISRNQTKLEVCARNVEEFYGVKTEIVQVDFGKGEPIYAKIKKALVGKEIGVLVNNVGMMTNKPKMFASITDEDIWNHVNVNIASVPTMMKMVLPDMVARKKGAIVNVASLAGLNPMPYVGIYAASKAFVDFMSDATKEEYKSKGITIQTVYPSYVATNMTSYHELVGKASSFVPDAKTYANSLVDTLGYSSRTTGYWHFGITFYLLQVIPRPVVLFCLKYVNFYLAHGKLEEKE